jgi:hypothetical protein
VLWAVHRTHDEDYNQESEGLKGAARVLLIYSERAESSSRIAGQGGVVPGSGDEGLADTQGATPGSLV